MRKSPYVRGVIEHRAESPEIEREFSFAIADAIKELLEQKGLYQNLELTIAVLEHLDDMTRPGLGATGSGGARGGLNPPIKIHEPRAKFVDEFRARHWQLLPEGKEIPSGDPAVHVAPSAHFIALTVPHIEVSCEVCKRRTSFSCKVTPSDGSSYPYPIEQKKPSPFGGEVCEVSIQLFDLTFECIDCRGDYLSVQFIRRGFRIQLTGRSKPFKPKLDSAWPKKIKSIIRDSIYAVQQADISAGFYHLRSAVEHHLKDQLGLPIEERHDGETLCKEYNRSLSREMTQRLPPVSVIYAESSHGLHTRSEDSKKLDELTTTFLKHLRGLNKRARFGDVMRLAAQPSILGAADRVPSSASIALDP